MEIKYPIIIIISIILFVLAFFISLSKIKSRKHKKKVANTSIVKESKEYKSLLFKYRIGMYIIYANSHVFNSIISLFWHTCSRFIFYTAIQTK